MHKKPFLNFTEKKTLPYSLEVRFGQGLQCKKKKKKQQTKNNNMCLEENLQDQKMFFHQNINCGLLISCKIRVHGHNQLQLKLFPSATLNHDNVDLKMSPQPPSRFQWVATAWNFSFCTISSPLEGYRFDSGLFYEEFLCCPCAHLDGLATINCLRVWACVQRARNKQTRQNMDGWMFITFKS